MPPRWTFLPLLVFAAWPAAGQPPGNFLQRVFGASTVDEQPLLSPAAPAFTFGVENLEFQVAKDPSGQSARLTIPDVLLALEVSRRRQGGIDLYTIRPTPETARQGEQIKLTWTFPESYNESMTLDAGALQGQPLHLPDGRMPDNHFTNWGSLFYNREANVAVGAQLNGAEPSRRARRGYSRFTRDATLQLMTVTGRPSFEIVLFAYRPKDATFWWAEWYQFRAPADENIPATFFPLLGSDELGWQPGDRQMVTVIPGPNQAGAAMELAVIDDVRRKLVARVPFRCSLPVTRVEVNVGDWQSSLYRVTLAAPGETIDPSVADLNRKLINVVVRPRRAVAPVLFVVPTDMWLAYATNGGHDYHGWRTGYDGSIGYAPTLMSSRRRRMNHFYHSLYDRYNDIHHFRYFDQLAAQDGFSIDYAAQHDIALGRVRLDDYNLVLIGNHCEFTTSESYRRFLAYLGRGGGVLIHGGDSFAVMVDYLPALDKPRYIWQRGHIWAHLGDQPSDFRPPVMLPPDAPPDAPILNPRRGDAIDYLNPFHTSVGYWIPDSKAVVSNTEHPVVRGLGLKLGDEVSGPWGGEVDILYEPRAWDVLIRSDKAAPEGREFGIDAYDPTPFHRVGLAVHKNLRLGVASGENYPNILVDPANTRYRELYRRTVRYLLDGARALEGQDRAISGRESGSNAVDLERAAIIGALRYELPEFVRYDEPGWWLKPAPFARYVVEGSADGQNWFPLADRRRGPWRGAQTDIFPPVEIRYVRFDGTSSNGEPFVVRNARAIPAE
ncbi:MAG: discoidin domain-containing protein [Bryobacteraceae bacterium]|nr:discoidin domain-containing protein [Bryobacteraceae bacterium]